MRRIFIFWFGLIVLSHFARGQQSPNTVNYQVTYNPDNQTYTAFVVPNYSTPNSNSYNTGQTESGSTAQFTLVVPKDFVISNITDVAGNWEKNPTKLGPGQPNQNWSAYSLNPALSYYVIGKSPSESAYGTFAPGKPVALFTFKGNSCFGPIRVLSPNDPFINAADQAYSLNVGNSFNSRSGQRAGGNVVPQEQFLAVAGTAASCTGPASVTARPDNTTTTAGTSTITNVLANDSDTGQPVTIANVSVSLSIPPTAGTAVINGDGTISYTPPANFTGTACYTYQICDLTSTTACSNAQVCITVLPKPPGFADIQLTKTVVGSKTRVLNDLITYTIVVYNAGPDAATNVVVKDSLVAGLDFQSAITSAGTLAGSLLTIPSLGAGQSTTLTVTAKVVAEGVLLSYARIVSQDQNDPNLNNNTAQTCVSVPVNVCQGESVLVNLPTTLTNVQWFKDNVLVGSGTTISFSDSGTYTFTASNSTCPAEGCCPLVIVQQVCCPKIVCVPFTITRTKRK